MAQRIPEESLEAIERAVARHPGGASLSDVAAALPEKLADRTLQYRLKHLVDKSRLVKEGEGRRWTRYRVPAVAETAPRALAEEAPKAITSAAEKAEDAAVPLSPTSEEIRAYLSQPLNARKPVGYNRVFLDSYRPNETFYLSEEQRAPREIGKGEFPGAGGGHLCKADVEPAAHRPFVELKPT